MLKTSLLSAVLLATSVSGFADDSGTGAFGSVGRQQAALVGILYDLKQGHDRKPLPGGNQLYIRTLDEFVAGGFDDATLARFFRATRPLYARRIWMPRMAAEAAPEAFGVASVVSPSLWIIHYKGQVAPPVSGTYRFLGTSDDVLVVAINGKVVLNANHSNTPMLETGWTPSEPPPAVEGTKHIVAGDWFSVREGEVLDLDIVVGERPGGSFLAHLYIQNREEPPQTNNQGQLQLGTFRLDDLPTPGKTPRPVEALPWKPVP
jgi:hypothetical protein